MSSATRERNNDPTVPVAAAPLSFEQDRFYVLQALDPANRAFNIGGSFRLNGKLNPSALEAAAAQVVARHHSLRTGISAGRAGILVQTVYPSSGSPIPFLDLSTAGGTGVPIDVLYEAVEEVQQRPLDLESGQPIRLQLIRLSEDDHVIVVVMHHLLSDGASLAVFLSEVAEAYAAIVQGRTPELGPEPQQYADYATTQRSLGSERRTRDLAYWIAELDGSRPIALPRDRFNYIAEDFVTPIACEPAAGSMAELFRVAGEEGATPFAALLSLVQLLLHYYCGATDIPLGYPVSVRDRQTTHAIGLYVNTLVLRTQVNRELSFRRLVRSNATKMVQGLRHRLAPFDQIVRALNPERHPSGATLYNITASFWNEAAAFCNNPFPLPGIRSSRLDPRSRAPQADVEFLGFLVNRRLRVELVYDPRQFSRQSMEVVGSALERLVDDLAKAPDAEIGIIFNPFPDWETGRWLSEPDARVRHPASEVAPDEEPLQQPDTDTEKRVAAAWCEFLGVEAVDRRDRFFELGGYSLLATQVAARLQEVFGVEVPLQLFLDAQSLSEFAAGIDALLRLGQ